jgi:hypothetical protein
VPLWPGPPGPAHGEGREISYISIGSRLAYRTLGAITAGSVHAHVRGGEELARLGKDPANHQEAAVVDSLIKKLRPFDHSYASGRASTLGARPAPRMRPIRAPMSSVAVWSCVGLGVLLGAALLQWPYERACGWWLALYMTAVGTVVVAGLWGARVSWTSRLGFAHVIAVCTIIWGLALTAQEVLPRVGYAKARLAWRCYDGHATAPSPARLSAVERRADGMVGFVR